MRTCDAISHFGSPSAVAKELGYTRQAINDWDEFVPPLAAMRLAKASRGRLKFDPDFYKDWYSKNRSRSN